MEFDYGFDAENADAAGAHGHEHTFLRGGNSRLRIVRAQGQKEKGELVNRADV